MEPTPILSVFVTGASNFVGRAVTRYLVASGHRVTGMTTGADGANAVRADGGLPVYPDRYRASEIRSNLQMAQADVVLHLASQADNHIPHVGARWDERLLAEGAAALVEAVKGSGVRFIVYSSFAFLYGNTGGEWVDETAARQSSGDSPVFEAAMRAEDLVLDSGMGCVLRCGYAYGPDSDVVRTIADRMRNGYGVITGSTSQYSNWIHADDLARAALLAAQKQAAGEVFNVTDGAPTSPVEFLHHLAESLGIASPRAGLLSFLMRPGRVQAALLDNSVRVKNEKAQQTLSWSPRYPTQQQGLEQIMLTWRAADSPARSAPESVDTAIASTA